MFKKKEKKSKEEKLKEKKLKKEAKEKLLKSTIDIIPIREYIKELEAFKLADGSYMDILKINPKDLENMNESDLNLEIINLMRILKTVEIDLKFVSMNFPLNTQNQREVLRAYRDKTVDAVREKWLNRQIDELIGVDSHVMTREFYIFFFGNDENSFVRNKNSVSKYLVLNIGTSLARFITKDEKIHILTKLCNMNSIEDIQKAVNYESNILEKKNKERLDTGLLKVLQPKGGLSFKECDHIRFGDGYVRCIHVHELPSNIHEHWLTNVFNISDCICSIDISSKDTIEVQKNLNKSIGEEWARRNTAKHFYEIYDAEKRQQELQLLYDNISRLGEVIKTCDYRIYVSAKTLEALDEKTESICKRLEAKNFKLTTMLNEQKKEFLSLFEAAKSTHKKPFTMNALAATSEQLAMGYPFDYSELIDEYGVLLGFTNTGGVVLYDQFTKTNTRKHYNSIVCGDMGSGKSTHLKKIFKHSASINDYIRVFDVSGEFRNLTNEFGGKIIKCNGQEGMLNPLEILKAGDDDSISYAIHINKLESFFKCLIPTLSDDLRQELSNYLKMFYQSYNLVPENGKITGLNSNRYPTFSDFKRFIESEIEYVRKLDYDAQTDVDTSINIDRAKYLNDILRAVDNIVNNYSNMFDGHTSINDITNEKIVTFDISSIKDLNNVFTAQMQNLISLCWDNAVANGSKMKELWESDNDVSQLDITKFLVLIDESHSWVNTSKPLILDMVIRYMREARKYFAGITLASQSVRDFMPQSSDKDLEKIKVLFELSQYKFMFKQDESAKKHIQEIFGSNMTFSQVERISKLARGETILSIAGEDSIEFCEWLSTDYEEKLFSGGR